MERIDYNRSGKYSSWLYQMYCILLSTNASIVIMSTSEKNCHNIIDDLKERFNFIPNNFEIRDNSIYINEKTYEKSNRKSQTNSRTP